MQNKNCTLQSKLVSAEFNKYTIKKFVRYVLDLKYRDNSKKVPPDMEKVVVNY